MKVACIQLSTGENYFRNINRNVELIKKAIRNKSDLIITPEVSTIMSPDKDVLYKNSFSMNKDPFLKIIKDIAKTYTKWIIIGSLSILEKNKLKNRSVVVNPTGKIVAFYDKINMFDVNLSKKEKYFESKTFTKGTKLKIVKLPWGNLGLTICYDIRFPELYRKLSKKKNKIYFNTFSFYKGYWKKTLVNTIKIKSYRKFLLCFCT